MQYPSRKSALKALRKLTKLRITLEGEEVLSPAEIDMLMVLQKTLLFREINKGQPTRAWKPSDERHFRNLKSIARGLNLYPVPEWAERYISVRERFIPKEEVIDGFALPKVMRNINKAMLLPLD